jgi:hypothetical protein
VITPDTHASLPTTTRQFISTWMATAGVPLPKTVSCHWPVTVPSALDGRQREIRIGSRRRNNVRAANAHLVNDGIGERCWTQSKKQPSEPNNCEEDCAFMNAPFQGNLAPANPFFVQAGSGWLKASHSRRQNASTRAMLFSEPHGRPSGRPNRARTMRLLSLVSDIAEAELSAGRPSLSPQSNSSAAAATAQTQGYARPAEESRRGDAD